MNIYPNLLNDAGIRSNDLTVIMVLKAKFYAARNERKSK